MTVTLTTADGDFVRTVQIPPFDPPPDVLTWGGRAFIRDPDDSDRALRYMEGLLYGIAKDEVGS